VNLSDPVTPQRGAAPGDVMIRLALALADSASAQAAPQQIPSDLLEIQPTAKMVNLVRWEAAQKEKERHACRTYVFHGDGESQILVECPEKKPSINWAILLEDTTVARNGDRMRKTSPPPPSDRPPRDSPP